MTAAALGGGLPEGNLTNGTDLRLRRAVGNALISFAAANKGRLDSMAVLAVAGTHLTDALWHIVLSITDPPLSPEMFGEMLRVFGETVARGDHLAKTEVLQ